MRKALVLLAMVAVILVVLYLLHLLLHIRFDWSFVVIFLVIAAVSSVSGQRPIRVYRDHLDQPPFLWYANSSIRLDEISKVVTFPKSVTILARKSWPSKYLVYSGPQAAALTSALKDLPALTDVEFKVGGRQAKLVNLSKD